MFHVKPVIVSTILFLSKAGVASKVRAACHILCFFLFVRASIQPSTNYYYPESVNQLVVKLKTTIRTYVRCMYVRYLAQPVSTYREYQRVRTVPFLFVFVGADEIFICY